MMRGQKGLDDLPIAFKEENQIAVLDISGCQIKQFVGFPQKRITIEKINILADDDAGFLHTSLGNVCVRNTNTCAK